MFFCISCKIFTRWRFYLFLIENWKFASRCRIASGLCGPLEVIVKHPQMNTTLQHLFNFKCLSDQLASAAILLLSTRGSYVTMEIRAISRWRKRNIDRYYQSFKSIFYLLCTLVKGALYFLNKETNMHFMAEFFILATCATDLNDRAGHVTA
jgi:hypothetical protein